MKAEIGNRGCWFVKMEVDGSDGGFHAARVCWWERFEDEAAMRFMVGEEDRRVWR